jgi:cytochrome d ubiquinol oxidase subunit I
VSRLGWIRALFGASLGFHILFATMGVGMPLAIALAEIAALRRRDPMYRLMARRWAGAFAVLLGTGVVSGTIVALQLQLLWPAFMRLVGQLIALPFAIEVFAFFIEAVFTAIYLYGGDRIPPAGRVVAALGVAVGAGASALLITDVNAFMNTPAGFRAQAGVLTDVRPWRAMLNPAMPTELSHVLVSAYLAVALVLGAFAAAGLLRAKTRAEIAYRQRELRLTVGVGALMAALTAFTGDLAGKFLAAVQPAKLAAAEGLFTSGRSMPLAIGGTVDTRAGVLRGGLRIPGLLSWLATGSLSGFVRGLDAVPRSQWPPVAWTHPLFDAMVGIGALAFVVAGAAWLWLRRSRPPRWLLALVVALGPLGLVGIECGWIFAELARQPWVISGIMTTADAATLAPDAASFFLPFMALYALVGLGAVVALRRRLRTEPLADAEELRRPAPEAEPAGVQR